MMSITQKIKDMSKKKKVIITVTAASLAVVLTMFLLVYFWVINKKIVDNRVFYEGTHIFTATETDIDLVSKGVSEYTVVYPETPTSSERVAMNEFITLFSYATNINMRVIKDSGLTHNAENKYISIGSTSLLETANIATDYTALKDDGTRIVTKDESVYIFGGKRNGALYGVYDFMSIMFNFETYYKDCYEIDRNVSNIKLRNFDVINIPDFAYRSESNGILNDLSGIYDADMLSSRLRINGSRADKFIPMHTAYDKNSQRAKTTNCGEILPRNTYGADHPLWFSDNGDQWCYTAHGDPDELDDMIAEVVKKIQFSLMQYTPQEYPDWNLVGVLHEDNSDYCTCDECNKLIARYGNPSGSMIRFLNRVAAFVDDWMNQPENLQYKRDDLKIVFFAYNFSTIAPAAKNTKTGKWQPIDSSVVMHPRLGIYLAPNNLYFNHSIYDWENNAGRENIDAWQSLTDFMMYWVYTANFKNFFYPVDSTSFLNSETLSYLCAKSSGFYANNGAMPQDGTLSGWYNLTMYVEAKLLWDTSLDEQVLIDNWFRATYKDPQVIHIMKQLYSDMMSHTKNVYFFKGWNTGAAVGANVNDRTLWPLATLEQWVAACDRAIEKLEKYKQLDMSLYNQVYDHIEIEAISPLYIILELHKNSLSSTVKNRIIARLTDNMNRMGLHQMRNNEHGGFLVDFLATI